MIKQVYSNDEIRQFSDARNVQRVNELQQILYHHCFIDQLVFARVHKDLGICMLRNAKCLAFSPIYYNQFFHEDLSYFGSFLDGSKIRLYGSGSLKKSIVDLLEYRTTVFGLTPGPTFIEYHNDYVDLFHYAISELDNRLDPILREEPFLRLFQRFFVKEMHDVLVNPKSYIAVEGVNSLISREVPKQLVKHQRKLLEDKPAVIERFERFKAMHMPIDIHLTARECECLSWAIKGKTAHETSIILGCSQRTVENHLYHIRERMGGVKLPHVIRTLEAAGYINDDEVFTRSLFVSYHEPE